MQKMADVSITESTLVVPSEETPGAKLRLSNFEQLSAVYYFCTVYFYRNNINNEASHDFFSIEVMKAALAKTLMIFYPLAGRLVICNDGRRVIDCNAEGALFVVARSECSSDNIDFEPSPELRNQFVPKATSSSLLAMLQITYLKCGGVVLGTAMNHALMDGRSASHFIQTWAAIARGELNSSVPPCFGADLLNARSPPKITFDYPDYETDQVKNTPAALSSGVTTKLRLSNEEISFLKSRCNEGRSNKRVSTFCAISALFWKCYCIAQELPPGTESQVHFSVDIRKRLQPPLPEELLGNIVIRTSTRAEVTELASCPIYVVSNTVKAAIDGITNEYVRSFIDYMEVNQDKKLSLKIDLPKSDLRISDLSGMPFNKIDFGWGAPELMTCAEAPGTNIIYIMNEPKHGGVVAYVILDPDTVHKFKKAFYFLHGKLCVHSYDS